MSENLPIGVLARRAGVKVPTIRYYEQVQLMPEAPRSDGNRRLYGDAAVRRLRFIKHARELGFEVEAIRELLDLAGQPDRPCADADRIARRHLEAVDRRIARLTALRVELVHMVDEGEHGRVGECRVIQVLADHGRCADDVH